MKKIVLDKQPGLENKPGATLLFKLLKALTHEDEINHFISTHQHLRGFAFLDKVLDYFNFTYQVSARSLNHIPAEGRVIIVANHPIGSLDGLALLKLVRTVRPDVRIVANELLTHLEPLQSLFLPVEVLSGKPTYKSQFRSMMSCLEKEEALIIFPAGEVSRIKPNGVRDGAWKGGFLKLARRTESPILPIFINAKNSSLFYGLSTVYKPLGTAMLVHEMFNKENQELSFHVGKSIPWKAVEQLDMPAKKLAKRFRRQLYQLGKKKYRKGKSKPLFSTVETIAHPAHRRQLKDDLFQSELLGETEDGKKIFLYDYVDDSPVMHEIGRLRELTFRTVEEGTGTALDVDHYDSYYRHLVLWDDNDLEIAGAYRLGVCADIVPLRGLEGLYTSSLFDLHENLQNLLPASIELGRSFVQPRYWGRRSLDYLWFGIGAYLRKHPEIKYLFGPVSLSQAYGSPEKDLILGFYQQQFGAVERYATARMPFTIQPDVAKLARQRFVGEYKEAYSELNSELKNYGVKVPTLYKQYAEVAEQGGCQFIAFNIDPAFNHCVDSLILVDLQKLKQRKRERYIGIEGSEENSIVAASA